MPLTTPPTVESTTEEAGGPKAEALISPKDLYKWLARIKVFLFHLLSLGLLSSVRASCCLFVAISNCGSLRFHVLFHFSLFLSIVLFRLFAWLLPHKSTWADLIYFLSDFH